MAINDIGVLRTSTIEVPQVLQREFSINHAKHIIRDFRRELLGTLTVCRTDIPEQYLVIDGRHRLYAAKYKGIQTLNCVILPSMSESEMARIFRGISDAKKMSTLDKFRSEARSGEPDVLIIQQICDKYNIPVGVAIGSKKKRGYYLRAINIIRIILWNYGAERLDQAMKIITSAWPGQPHAMYEAMIYGTALFCEYFGKQEVFSEDRAIKQFSKKSAESIVSEGKERRKNRGAIPAIEIATPILRNLYNYRATMDKKLRTSPELEELAFKSKQRG